MKKKNKIGSIILFACAALFSLSEHVHASVQACAYYYSTIQETILPGKGYGLVEFQTNQEEKPDSAKSHQNVSFGGFSEVTEVLPNNKGEKETFVAAIRVPYTGIYKVTTMILSQSDKNTFALVKNIGEIYSNSNSEKFTPGFVTDFTLINGGTLSSLKPKYVTNQCVLSLQGKDTLSVISLEQLGDAVIGKVVDSAIEKQGIDGPVSASIIIELISLLD